jgi:hypothetical protein
MERQKSREVSCARMGSLSPSEHGEPACGRWLVKIADDGMFEALGGFVAFYILALTREIRRTVFRPKNITDSGIYAQNSADKV